MPVRLLSLFMLMLMATAASAAAQQTPPDTTDSDTTDAVERDLTAALTAEAQAALTPTEVIRLLKEGNERFVNDEAVERNFMEQVRQTAEGQYPMAAILGCIDSRVPHEIIFDKGVGDVFSARVAGNFVNTDILGSLEFATAVAGSKVIVVLGHTECGAVKGACDGVEVGNLAATLANIAPAIYRVGNSVEGPQTSENKEYVQAVAHANVDITVQNTVDRSPIIRGLVESGDLIVVGAMHDVATGEVTFYEDSMITAETIEAD